MRLFPLRATGFFQAVLVLALANGCQASSNTSSDPVQLAAARVPAAAALQSQQLIIKFKQTAGVACDGSRIARFSEAAGVPLQLVRPMSGQACVVKQSGAGAAELTHGLDALRKNPAVEFVEPDAVMKIQ